MGRAVQRIALERGHEVPVVVDPHCEEASSCCLSADILEGIDVVIDFSSADAVMDNVKICKEAGVNLVVGTTGWYDKMEEVKGLVGSGGKAEGDGTSDAEAKGYAPPSSDEWKGETDSNANAGMQREIPAALGFLWSSNFSIGVNLY